MDYRSIIHSCWIVYISSNIIQICAFYRSKLGRRVLTLWSGMDNFSRGASAINVIEQTCITFIKNKIPHKALKWIILVFRIAIIIFLIVLIITGFQFARLGKMSKTLALWGLSQYWAFLAIPVGSVFMTISYIIKTILDFFMFEETNHKQEAVQI